MVLPMRPKRLMLPKDAHQSGSKTLSPKSPQRDLVIDLTDFEESLQEERNAGEDDASVFDFIHRVGYGDGRDDIAVSGDTRFNSPKIAPDARTRDPSPLTRLTDKSKLTPAIPLEVKVAPKIEIIDVDADEATSCHMELLEHDSFPSQVKIDLTRTNYTMKSSHTRYSTNRAAEMILNMSDGSFESEVVELGTVYTSKGVAGFSYKNKTGGSVAAASTIEKKPDPQASHTPTDRSGKSKVESTFCSSMTGDASPSDSKLKSSSEDFPVREVSIISSLPRGTDGADFGDSSTRAVASEVLENERRERVAVDEVFPVEVTITSHDTSEPEAQKKNRSPLSLSEASLNKSPKSFPAELQFVREDRREHLSPAHPSNFINHIHNTDEVKIDETSSNGMLMIYSGGVAVDAELFIQAPDPNRNCNQDRPDTTFLLDKVAMENSLIAPSIRSESPSGHNDVDVLCSETNSDKGTRNNKIATTETRSPISSTSGKEIPCTTDKEFSAEADESERRRSTSDAPGRSMYLKAIRRRIGKRRSERKISANDSFASACSKMNELEECIDARIGGSQNTPIIVVSSTQDNDPDDVLLESTDTYPKFPSGAPIDIPLNFPSNEAADLVTCSQSSKIVDIHDVDGASTPGNSSFENPVMNIQHPSAESLNDSEHEADKAEQQTIPVIANYDEQHETKEADLGQETMPAIAFSEQLDDNKDIQGSNSDTRQQRCLLHDVTEEAFSLRKNLEASDEIIEEDLHTDEISVYEEEVQQELHSHVSNLPNSDGPISLDVTRNVPDPGVSPTDAHEVDTERIFDVTSHSTEYQDGPDVNENKQSESSRNENMKSSLYDDTHPRSSCIADKAVLAENIDPNKSTFPILSESSRLVVENSVPSQSDTCEGESAKTYIDGGVSERYTVDDEEVEALLQRVTGSLDANQIEDCKPSDLHEEEASPLTNADDQDAKFDIEVNHVILQLIENVDDPDAEVRNEGYSKDFAMSDCESQSSEASEVDTLYLSSSESDDDILGLPKPSIDQDSEDEIINRIEAVTNAPYRRSYNKSVSQEDIEFSSEDVSESKLSRAYSGTSESEGNIEYDIYDACAMPIARLLDRGCGWLDNDDESCLHKSSPSLLYKLQKSNSKKLKAKRSKQRFIKIKERKPDVKQVSPYARPRRVDNRKGKEPIQLLKNISKDVTKEREQSPSTAKGLARSPKPSASVPSVICANSDPPAQACFVNQLTNESNERSSSRSRQKRATSPDPDPGCAKSNKSASKIKDEKETLPGHTRVETKQSVTTPANASQFEGVVSSSPVKTDEKQRANQFQLDEKVAKLKCDSENRDDDNASNCTPFQRKLQERLISIKTIGTQDLEQDCAGQVTIVSSKEHESMSCPAARLSAPWTEQSLGTRVFVAKHSSEEPSKINTKKTNETDLHITTLSTSSGHRKPLPPSRRGNAAVLQDQLMASDKSSPEELCHTTRCETSHEGEAIDQPRSRSFSPGNSIVETTTVQAKLNVSPSRNPRRSWEADNEKYLLHTNSAVADASNLLRRRGTPPASPKHHESIRNNTSEKSQLFAKQEAILDVSCVQSSKVAFPARKDDPKCFQPLEMCADPNVSPRKMPFEDAPLLVHSTAQDSRAASLLKQSKKRIEFIRHSSQLRDPPESRGEIPKRAQDPPEQLASTKPKHVVSRTISAKDTKISPTEQTEEYQEKITLDLKKHPGKDTAISPEVPSRAGNNANEERKHSKKATHLSEKAIQLAVAEQEHQRERESVMRQTGTSQEALNDANPQGTSSETHRKSDGSKRDSAKALTGRLIEFPASQLKTKTFSQKIFMVSKDVNNIPGHREETGKVLATEGSNDFRQTILDPACARDTNRHPGSQRFEVAPMIGRKKESKLGEIKSNEEKEKMSSNGERRPKASRSEEKAKPLRNGGGEKYAMNHEIEMTSKQKAAGGPESQKSIRQRSPTKRTPGRIDTLKVCSLAPEKRIMPALVATANRFKCDDMPYKIRPSPENSDISPIRKRSPRSTQSPVENPGTLHIPEAEDLDEELNATIAGLNEEERLAALELVEKLRRRAVTLKRRRKMKAKRLTEIDDDSFCEEIVVA